MLYGRPTFLGLTCFGLGGLGLGGLLCNCEDRVTGRCESAFDLDRCQLIEQGSTQGTDEALLTNRLSVGHFDNVSLCIELCADRPGYRFMGAAGEMWGKSPAISSRPVLDAISVGSLGHRNVAPL